MQESEIRRQTNIVIQAYESLVGGDISLSVDEFIAIRKQAENEITCKMSAAKEVSLEDRRSNQPAKTENNIRSIPHIRPLQPEEDRTAHRENGGENDDKGLIQQDEPSDFDILRKAPDEWN